MKQGYRDIGTWGNRETGRYKEVDGEAGKQGELKR